MAGEAGDGRGRDPLDAAESAALLADQAFEGLALSVEGRVVACNDAFCELSGLSRAQAIGITVAALTTPEGARTVMEHIRAGTRTPYVIEARRADGRTFPCEIRGRTFEHGGRTLRVTSFRDISERRQHEEEQRRLHEKMRETQHLESVGLLAGGIAHDFNNLLVTVLSHAELARDALPAGSAALPHVEQIEVAARRAAELTHQVLTYAGRAQRAEGVVDLAALVRDMIKLLEASVSASIRIVDETSQDPTVVEGDETQLRQVVMNFVMNAAEAIGAGSGRIVLRTVLVDVDDAMRRDTRWHGTLHGGPHVRLEVADDGRGMDEATRTRMFDPFFSTKGSGRGLGLAAVLGILRTHGAAVRVESAVGRGTTISVLLPASERTADAIVAPPPDDEPWMGAGTVLVIDDVPEVRSAAQAVLRSVGFEVITAVDGRAGIEAWDAHRSDVVAILLDATMPSMDGRATLEALVARGCRAPVVMTSGFTNESFDGVASVAAFLPKPFGVDSLVACLRRVLG